MKTEVYFDVETRSRLDIRKVGTLAYAQEAKVIIFAYAIDDGPVQDWSLPDFSGALDWWDAPADLRKALRRAYDGEAVFIAFNSGFDRNMVNHGMRVGGRRETILPVETVLDAAVAASASNLPASLQGFSTATGGAGKLPDGSRLVQHFCVDGGATPADRPDEWEQFRAYARQDVEALRDAWHAVLKPSEQVWREFHAAERINDRGLPVNLPLAASAARLAEQYLKYSNDQVFEISGGDLYSVAQHEAMARWVFDRVGAVDGAQDAMAKTYHEDAEGGGLVPEKIGLDRHRVARLIAMLGTLNEAEGLSDEEHAALRILRLREYGASAAPKKFAKVLSNAVNGRLPSQYVFNGAQQTGRFSSRGVQMHNLTRNALSNEAAVLEAMDRNASLTEFIEVAGDPGRALSWTVRPVISAPEGRHLVWGDWSNIEARVLPWLAGDDHPGAAALLDVFTRVDKDPENTPDLYCVEAAKIEGLALNDLWSRYRDKDPAAKASRLRGKVANLALGFGGGVGALVSMAANYGLAFAESEAERIVAGWRTGNPWARRFWDALWGAFTAAVATPGMEFRVGRLMVLGTADYVGQSTVFVVLPDGRPLAYPGCRWSKRKHVDPKTQEVTYRDTLVFRGAYGEKALWYGTLAENATQATAACILRHTLVRLEAGEGPLEVVGHTHDEIIAECAAAPAVVGDARAALKEAMLHPHEWLQGLPVACEIEDHWFYTNAGY